MRFGNLQYRSRRGRQQGYIILVLALMVTLVLIGLAMELPNIANQMKHDREEETIHRGVQYARAIKMFVKKTGAYPVRIEQLEDTNHIRFLRKRYKDPMTGEDFRLLHLGEVQLSPKVAGSSTGPGVAPGSGVNNAAAQAGQTAGGSMGSSGSSFGSNPGGSTFGGSNPGGSTFGGSNPGGSTFGGSSFGNSGPGNPSSGTSSGSSPLSSPGGKGPTFGGGPIIGVTSTSEKQSLHVFNEKDHYNEWEFIYDQSLDRCASQFGCLIIGPYNGMPKFGGGQVPGAVSPGQMQPGSQQSPFGQNPGGQSPNSQSPFGQNPMQSPTSRP